jgi:hypothetical protein
MNMISVGFYDMFLFIFMLKKIDGDEYKFQHFYLSDDRKALNTY